LKSLGLGGRFIEIGKVDILAGTDVSLAPFLQDLSFLSVQLDIVMDKNPRAMKTYLSAVAQLAQDKAIGPIVDRVFAANDVEQAFRYTYKSPLL